MNGLCRRVSLLAAALGAAGVLSSGVAAPSPSPTSSPQQKMQTLSAEEMAKATKLDTLTVPTPGELFAALNKVGKPNWQQQYRGPIPTAYTSRPQIALNLGGLIADGYIAVEAEDAQQVRNIARDIVTLAKGLGVSENVLRRGKSIEDFADTNEWSTLKEELEATQNEVKLAMEEQHDQDLVTLVTLGAWIRGTEAVSGWITQNYSAEAARLLRHPAIVSFLRGKLAGLPPKLREESLIKGVNEKLAALEQQTAFPREQAPSLEDVQKLKETASDLVRSISKK